MRHRFIEQIHKIPPEDFEQLALLIFQFQAKENKLYKKYLSLIGVKPSSVGSLLEIPFLPISFFKTHQIKTGSCDHTSGQQTVVFTSSGTTGRTTSQHFVKDLDFYEKNTRLGFESVYGPVKDYCILALLPSYLERTGSSLIYMTDHFIRLSKYSQSGYFLYDHSRLAKVLTDCKKNKIPTLLIGVSYALLDFAEKYSLDLEELILMETGGMKGRKKEITRHDLHEQLKKAFNLPAIHSEYGMTELLSQAYAQEKGIFFPSATMRVLTREITDPFNILKSNNTGALNIIDLANLDSCAFIASDDLGRVYNDGSFEVLGRLDHSDIRGCNLMVQ